MSVLLVILGVTARDVVPAVADVNLTLYTGRWYQVSADVLVTASFEAGAACVTADYALDTSPTYGPIVRLVNSETVNGELSNVTGFAYAADAAAPAELTVQFDAPPVTGSYWIVKLGPVENDAYAYAVVSDKKSQTLFVLARDLADYQQTYADDVDAFLADNGFTGAYKPIVTDQDECTYAPLLELCPSSPARMHAGCDETVTFPEASCDDVMAEIVGRVEGQYNVWSDPHNNGTYAIVQQAAGFIALTRLTGDGKYTDKLNFRFDNNADDGCVVAACSQSQVASVIDFGTNHCNLFALFCGTADGCPIVHFDLAYDEVFHECTDSTTSCVGG